MICDVDIGALLADLRVLLDHVTERGIPLTDTGRMRIADVRAINALFVAPEVLDRQIGPRTYHPRSEDEAWRVHFLRLLGQAAGLLDARRGRLRRAASAQRLDRLDPEDAARDLIAAWWWKGAWDLLPGIEGVPQMALMRDRNATATALLALGTASHPLEALGTKLRRVLAPGASASTGLGLSDLAWGYAAWSVCLEPLAAFGGAHPTMASEEVNGRELETLAAVRLSDAGLALLRGSLEARPAARPRVQRGMRGGAPLSRAATGPNDELALMIEAERRERILREHPDYRDAIARGTERVGEVNPRAHVALHAAVDAQLAGDEPPEVRAAYDRLVAAGYEEHTVLHGLADALGREIWRAEHDRRQFDNASYLARIAAFPLEEDTEGDELPSLPSAKLAAAERVQLLGLPRTSTIWEGDLTELPIEVAEHGRPLCAIWADAGDGTVRALRQGFDAIPGVLVLAAFVEAALRPTQDSGRPALPERVRVHPELATALDSALDSVGVAVETAEELPSAHAALDSLGDFLGKPPRRQHRHRGRRRRTSDGLHDPDGLRD